MYVSSFPIALTLILGVIAFAVLWLLRYDAPEGSKLRQRRFFLWTHVWIVGAVVAVFVATLVASVSFEIPQSDSNTDGNNSVFSGFVSKD